MEKYIKLMNTWCHRCTHDRQFDHDTYEDGCQILNRSLVYAQTEPEYPEELQPAPDGGLSCTAFKSTGCRLQCPPMAHRRNAA